MRNLLKISIVAFLGLCPVLAFANEPAVVTTVEGQPVIITLDDQHVITIKITEAFTMLTTSATLSDNTCTTTVSGIKALYHVPMVRRALVPIWLKHPTMQGQPVLEFESYTKRNEVASVNYFASPLQGEKFYRDLARIPADNAKDEAIRQAFLKDHNQLAWMDCTNCAQVFPKHNHTILFWDENFENENDNITMSIPDRSPKVNQITSRLQQVPLNIDGKRISIAQPQVKYGDANYLPPGITYQFQWNFRAQSLIDADDQMCQVKWDLNFTTIFTIFTQSDEECKNPKLLDLKKLRPYLYSQKDGDEDTIKWLFSPSHWGSGIVK